MPKIVLGDTFQNSYPVHTLEYQKKNMPLPSVKVSTIEYRFCEIGDWRQFAKQASAELKTVLCELD